MNYSGGSSFGMTILQSILLVDDDEADNFFHRRAIADSGYCSEVVVAEAAQEALSLLESCTERGVAVPELLFVDIKMPAVNGWGFLELHAQLPPAQQAKAVVVLSNSENPKHHALAKSLGAALIPKPLSIESLANTIEEVFPGLIASRRGIAKSG